MALSDEIRKMRRRQERLASQDMRPMLQAYRNALKRVQGELNDFLLDHIEDGKLTISQQNRIDTLKKLEKQIVEQAREIGGLELETTKEILKNRYDDAYYRTAYHLDRGLEPTVSFSLLRPEMVEAAVYTPIKGEMFSNRIWKNKDKMVVRLRDIFERNLINGKDPAKLARLLKSEFGTSAFESTRLVQNEVARVTRQAADRIYEQSDVVEELMYDATLDSHTSDFCEEHDGRTYPINDKPEIPDDSHVGCRSDYVPVVRGWEPSRKYENEAKKEIDYTSVNTWKATRGIS